MRVLVTGGEGFIGSHVADGCKRLEYEVVLADLKSGIDVSKPSHMKRLGNDFQFIFHLAAKASIPDSIKYPVQSHNNNIGATLQVLELARRSGAVVVYSSSSSVGFTPMTPYSTQKKMGEEYLQLYHDLYGVKCVSLRYFNVYGERQEISNGGYALVLPLWLKQKEEGKPLSITGTGGQRRDFVHVSDVVKANFMAARYAWNQPHAIFEVGTGTNYSINEIADVIDRGEREWLPARVEPFEIIADKSKFLPGWEPTTHILEWLLQ